LLTIATNLCRHHADGARGTRQSPWMTRRTSVKFLTRTFSCPLKKYRRL
jgi:hypothetical protein